MCLLKIATHEQGFRRAQHLGNCPDVGMSEMWLAVVLR